MALTNEEKIKVVNNHEDVSSLGFRELLQLGMIAHASTILYEEDTETYDALPANRKALVDFARKIILDPDYYLESFVSRYANDSELTTISGNLISKIPDIVPAIFPEMVGLIRRDRPGFVAEII